MVLGGDEMSNIGNKETMSKNLKYYIEKSGKDRKELAKIWGFPYSTVTDWINGKKYPRIDRIEIMADYFGILKSDLIEEKTKEHREMQQKNSTLADITVRMRTDSEFFNLIEGINQLNPEQLASLKPIVDVLLLKG
jgi:ribosome-binding protein aMBF1 (putative translation factor)